MFKTFSDLDTHTTTGQNILITPFFTVANKNEEEKFRWLKDVFTEMVDRSESSVKRVNSNYKFYKGEVIAGDRVYREDDTDEMDTRSNDTKLYINYIRKLLEEQVNRLLELKPNVDVLPVHNEQDDKVGAKLGKYLLDTVWYEENVDKLLRHATNAAFIAGDHYVGILWDDEKGDFTEEFKEAAKKTRGNIPMLNDDGEEIEGSFVDTALTEGDLKYEHIDTRKMLLEPVESGEFLDCSWAMVMRVEYRDVLKKRYPGKVEYLGKFDPVDAGINYIAQEQIDRLNREGKTLTITFYHKPTTYLPKGKEILFTVNGILHECDHKYSHKLLPFVRRTNVETPGELKTDSFIEDVKGLQIQYYALTSGILANQKLFAYPKWFVPQGAVTPQALAAGRGIVQYRGQRPPQVYSPAPTPAEIFTTRDSFREEMRFIGTGSENTPGSPPVGITAGVALQYLNEQDLKRFNTEVAKHFEFIKEIALMTLSVCGKYMTKDHTRMNKIVGKSNIHALKDFANVELDRPYDIRVAQSTGLPDSKAARVQTILDIEQSIQGTFSREQILDFLDLGDSGKMFDQATAAVKAAESIIEDLLSGVAVIEPTKYENLIVHWKVFITRIQQRDFKASVSAERQQAVLDYIEAMEMLMTEKSSENPRFAQEVEMLSLFPAVFILPPPPPPIDPAMMGPIEEGDPMGAPLLPPNEMDGSGAADPGQELLLNERSDSGVRRG